MPQRRQTGRGPPAAQAGLPRPHRPGERGDRPDPPHRHPGRRRRRRRGDLAHRGGTPGTVFALLSDGIADSLPTDAIDRITRRRAVQRAAPEIVGATRRHRLRERRREKASLSEMGLDNMSVVLARFEGPPATRSAPPGSPAAPEPSQAPAAPAPASAPSSALPDGRLVWLHGLRGGPHPDSGGPFGLVCLAPPGAIPVVLPRFLRSYLDSEDVLRGQERLARAYISAAGPRINLPFSAVAMEEGARRPPSPSPGGPSSPSRPVAGGEGPGRPSPWGSAPAPRPTPLLLHPVHPLPSFPRQRPPGPARPARPAPPRASSWPAPPSAPWH